jgi:hypothetical protein
MRRMVPRFLTLCRFIVPLAIALASVASVALAAPSSSPPPESGVVVSRGADCSVALVATSYDDPGADDAEFIELRVVLSNDAGVPSRAGVSNSPSHADLDASADASAAIDGSAGPTLASCGLDALELVDGANGGCATYRHIPLGAVAVPADGYVVLCAAASTVDERAHCDVTTAGRSALRAGWLQNGPNDGFRFVPVADGPVAIAYEGRPACFPAATVELALESGAFDGDATVDDVNVACGGGFVLLPDGDVPLRTEPLCPVPRVDGSDAAVVAGSVDGSDATAARDAGLDASWAPELAPPPASHGPSHNYGPLYVDAAPLVEPAPRSPPKAPGCVVARTSTTGRSFAAWFTAPLVAFALFALRRTRRRRTTRPGPRLSRARGQALESARRAFGGSLRVRSGDG